MRAVANEAAERGVTPLKVIQEEAVPGIKKLTEERAFWIYTRPAIHSPEDNWKDAQSQLHLITYSNLMPDSICPCSIEQIEQVFESTIGKY